LKEVGEQLIAYYETAELPKVRFDRLSITNGRVRFTDSGLAEPLRAEIYPLDLRLDGLATLPGTSHPHRFTAKLPEGAELEWSGELEVKPLRARGAIRLDGATAKVLLPYIQEMAAVDIPTGSLRLEIPYALDTATGQLDVVITNGNVRLTDLSAHALDSGQQFLALPQAEISGIFGDLQAEQVGARSIETTDAVLEASRLADGSIDLVRLFKSSSDRTPEAPAGAEKHPLAWQVQLDQLRIENTRLRLTRLLPARMVFHGNLAWGAATW
jgi:hypothetical protein